MQFDFSAIDAELERLGPAAEDALALAQRYAPPELVQGAFGGPPELDQIDRTLAALESDGEPLPPISVERELPLAPARGSAPRPAEEPAARTSEPPAGFAGAFPSEPPRSDAPSEPPAPAELSDDFNTPPPPPQAQTDTGASLTQSQEIALLDPVRDEPATVSGELRLDGEEPSSGSFELPESATEPRITVADRQPPLGLEPFDDVQDALEGSQPIMLSAPPARTAHVFQDRDPDAEFDALLSEATDPRGIPTGVGAGNSGEVDTDDLLRGLEGDEVADDEVSIEDLSATHADDEHEADLLTRSLFEDAAESTDITDRSALVSALAAGSAGADADVSLADELDADDLEIVMEDDDGATLAPPAEPQPSKASPPPPPGPNKRSNPLGRLFNKRERDSDSD